MALKNEKQRPDMIWRVLDVTDMSKFATDTFDLVIDKSTIDCLFCREDYVIKLASMLMHTQRILKPGGHYFVVSYGKPKARLQHFEREFLSWDIREFILYDADVKTEEEKLEKTHYIYVCKVNEDANEVCKLYWDEVFENMKIDNEV